MPEYQNIPLLPGEDVLFAADFTSSPILRSQKSGLVVTRHRVAVVHPQHVFVFFKVGQVVHSSPIRTITEVSVGRLLSPHRLRAAMVFGFIGLFFLSVGGIGFGGLSVIGVLLALILFAAAGLQLWLARHLGLTVCHFGGRTLSVRVDPTEHQAMLAAAHLIQQLLVDVGSAAQNATVGAPASGSRPANPAMSRTPGPNLY